MNDAISPILMARYLAEVQARRCFLLMLRWARENGETEFTRGIPVAARDRVFRDWMTYVGANKDGPAAIDLERACADLTYREAMDLRWALDIWREPRPRRPARAAAATGTSLAPQKPGSAKPASGKRRGTAP